MLTSLAQHTFTWRKHLDGGHGDARSDPQQLASGRLSSWMLLTRFLSRFMGCCCFCARAAGQQIKILMMRVTSELDVLTCGYLLDGVQVRERVCCHVSVL